MAQAEQAAKLLEKALPGTGTEILKLVTTGDKRDKWSLEKEGGKGLFTKELEDALLEGRADIAVHSAKDLPTDMPEGLAIAAYLPRECPHDVLLVQDSVSQPVFIATSSPRRRSQLKKFYPKAVWSEIRGNVDTRLKKVAGGHQAEATMLAAAGLRRLHISEWPGLVFKPMDVRQMVPAVGQGAIALQTRGDCVHKLSAVDDTATRYAVDLERYFLAAMGGGCHVATAAHLCGDTLLTYHDQHGYAALEMLKGNEHRAIDAYIAKLRHAEGSGND